MLDWTSSRQTQVDFESDSKTEPVDDLGQPAYDNSHFSLPPYPIAFAAPDISFAETGMFLPDNEKDSRRTLART